MLDRSRSRRRHICYRISHSCSKDAGHTIREILGMRAAQSGSLVTRHHPIIRTIKQQYERMNQSIFANRILSALEEGGSPNSMALHLRQIAESMIWNRWRRSIADEKKWCRDVIGITRMQLRMSSCRRRRVENARRRMRQD